MNGIPKVSLLQDIIYQQLLLNQLIRKMAVSQQHALSGDYQTTEILPKSETPVNLAASNQVSALSESLATQLPGIA